MGRGVLTIGQTATLLVMVEVSIGHYVYIKKKREDGTRARERATKGTADEYMLHSWSLR